MQTGSGPTTPQNDIAAWHADRAEPRAGLLTSDLRALAQNGATILIAAQDGDRPVVGFAVCCRVLADGRLRLVLSRTAHRRLLDALEAGSKVAATFTGNAQLHRAFQVKAAGATVGATTSDDGPEVDRQIVLFCDGLTEIGFTRELSAGWLALDRSDLAAVEITPERIFTQTPGPGAGAELPR